MRPQSSTRKAEDDLGPPSKKKKTERRGSVDGRMGPDVPLIVLDIDGTLVQRLHDTKARPCTPCTMKCRSGMAAFHVYRRPHCKEFVAFCFENFEVAVWTSGTQRVMKPILTHPNSGIFTPEQFSSLRFVAYRDFCQLDPSGPQPWDTCKRLSHLQESTIVCNDVRECAAKKNTLIIDDSARKLRFNPAPNTMVVRSYDFKDTEIVFEEDDTLLMVREQLASKYGIEQAPKVREQLASTYGIEQAPKKKKGKKRRWTKAEKLAGVRLPEAQASGHHLSNQVVESALTSDHPRRLKGSLVT